MTTRRIALVLAAFATIALCGDAWAQKQGEHGDRWKKRRDKIRKKIRSLRAWRLTEALDLDEKTAGKLFPILSDYDDKFAALAERARKTRRALRKELSAATPNRKRLARLIDTMQDQHKAQYEWQRDRFKAVRKVLTPEQAAKAVVLLPELDRQIRREIRKAMRGKNGRRKHRNRDLEAPF